MKHEPDWTAASATLGPVEPATVALVAQLRSARRSQIRPAAQRTLIALSIAAVLGLAHFARIGTHVTRGLALSVLIAIPLGLVAAFARARLCRSAETRRCQPPRAASNCSAAFSPAAPA